MLANEFYVESINPANIFGAIRCRDLNDIRTRNCVVSGESRRLGGEYFGSNFNVNILSIFLIIR